MTCIFIFAIGALCLLSPFTSASESWSFDSEVMNTGSADGVTPPRGLRPTREHHIRRASPQRRGDARGNAPRENSEATTPATTRGTPRCGRCGIGLNIRSDR